MSIKRWDFKNEPQGAVMHEFPHTGHWVYYDDHSAAITKLEEENAKLRGALQKVVQDVTDAVWRVV